ncbi:hypothetical protein LZ31DRAFT_560582 [Colletotrichum somersetense]|nr:hypothetical protein LZ31DRAFT_560582 [Colletotrichum somersetense]
MDVEAGVPAYTQAGQLPDGRRSWWTATTGEFGKENLPLFSPAALTGLARHGTAMGLSCVVRANQWRRISRPVDQAGVRVTIEELIPIRPSDTIQTRQVGSIADGRIASVRLGRIKSCKQPLGMTGALLDSQPPVSREPRISSSPRSRLQLLGRDRREDEGEEEEEEKEEEEEGEEEEGEEKEERDEEKSDRFWASWDETDSQER